MAELQIYEGTADEIADQLRNSKLSGRLKAFVTLSGLSEPDEADGTLADRLQPLFADLDQQEFVPGKPHTDRHEKVIARSVAKKFARRGHTK